MNPAQASHAYLEAVLAGDRRRAFSVVDQARGDGIDIRSLYMDVLQPAMREIGQLWQRNQISVAVEHLATAITEAAMARVYSDIFDRANDTGPSLLAACAETERHVIGLRMVCDLLELAGWQTIFLGASVPLESLKKMTVDVQPQVVALSASIAPHVLQVRATIHALRTELRDQTPLITVGGRPFLEDPGLAARIGADLTAADAAALVEQLQTRFASERVRT